MKKGIAIVVALGAVVGFAAYCAFKQIKEELEATMPMDQDDFGNPVVHDNCEGECECGGECNCGCDERECTCANGAPAPGENNA